MRTAAPSSARWQSAAHRREAFVWLHQTANLPSQQTHASAVPAVQRQPSPDAGPVPVLLDNRTFK